MTQLRWSILFLTLLFPTATDLLWKEVSSVWLSACTILALLWDLVCGWHAFELAFCFVPGMLLWVLARFCHGIGSGDVLCAFLIGAVCTGEIGLGILFGGSVLCFFGQMYRGIVIAVGKKRRIQKDKKKPSSEMPFVPWLLVSVCINWIFQICFT